MLPQTMPCNLLHCRNRHVLSIGETANCPMQMPCKRCSATRCYAIQCQAICGMPSFFLSRGVRRRVHLCPNRLCHVKVSIYELLLPPLLVSLPLLSLIPPARC